MNPIQKFMEWQQAELAASSVTIPKAACLSTVGLDGFPNARFVELKEVFDGNFIVTGPISSRKGLEIEQCNKVALTCWWTATEKQVRIQGKALKISDQLADTYFSERHLGSRIVSNISDQGQELDDIEALIAAIEHGKETLTDADVTRPDTWSGFAIVPYRIEFFEFTDTRFHQRILFEFDEGSWTTKHLQP